MTVGEDRAAAIEMLLLETRWMRTNEIADALEIGRQNAYEKLTAMYAARQLERRAAAEVYGRGAWEWRLA